MSAKILKKDIQYAKTECGWMATITICSKVYILCKSMATKKAAEQVAKKEVDKINNNSFKELFWLEKSKEGTKEVKEDKKEVEREKYNNKDIALYSYYNSLANGDYYGYYVYWDFNTHDKKEVDILADVDFSSIEAENIESLSVELSEAEKEAFKKNCYILDVKISDISYIENDAYMVTIFVTPTLKAAINLLLKIGLLSDNIDLHTVCTFANVINRCKDDKGIIEVLEGLYLRLHKLGIINLFYQAGYRTLYQKIIAENGFADRIGKHENRRV